MSQLDFFGGLPPAAPFKDIRNTRPSAAEEKARLCLDLIRLCQTPPKSVRNGSVNLTREWLACQRGSKALAANSRASVVALEMAIKSMQRFVVV